MMFAFQNRSANADHFRAKTEISLHYLARCAEVSYFQHDVCFLKLIFKCDHFRAKTERSLLDLAQFAEVSYFQHNVCFLESICKC